jgi:L-threonylcarbamoyladenylate synthase
MRLATLPEADFRRAGGELAAARLAVFPTDTVYGVGGLLSPSVFKAVYAAKGRAAGKPLQVVYPTVDFLESALALESRLGEAVRRLLPGPFTLLLPYPQGLGFPPAGVASHHVHGTFGLNVRKVATLGVRVPLWPDAARFMAGLPFALLASSANPSGGKAPQELAEVDPNLLASCDLVLDGGHLSGMASSIVDLSTYAGDGRWRLLRTGSVGEEQIAALLGSE